MSAPNRAAGVSPSLDVAQALALAVALVDGGADLDRVEKFDGQRWRVSVRNPDDTFDVYYEPQP